MDAVFLKAGEPAEFVYGDEGTFGFVVFFAGWRITSCVQFVHACPLYSLYPGHK
jgi:hypothetical protein